MKRIALIAVLTALSLSPAASQAQGEKPAAAKPAAAMKMEKAAPQEAGKPAPAPKIKKVAAQEAGKAAPARSGRSRANEDARSCLELATNVEIIKCAEKYR